MKVLILICAALGYDTFKRNKKAGFWEKMSVKPIQNIFPALTCPFQATLRTGVSPQNHGVIANGFVDCEIRKSFFWEQSSNLIKAPYIWENFRKKNGKVAQLFMQQSLGPDSDIILSPAPIHKHHGGMIQDCYSRPNELYKKISSQIGKKFNLFDYWGPFTSGKSSLWITSAIQFLLKEDIANVIFAYLPHLDYDLQRHGPNNEKEKRSFLFLENLIEKIFNSAKIAGYDILIIGDYQIENVNSFIQPNKILLQRKLFSIRNINGMLYPDFFSSKAFALCDHQVALLYIFDKNVKNEVYDIFKKTDGVAEIKDINIGNNSPDFIISSKHEKWFSYKWWDLKREAPDYATHVDIHNKPGFDPCELFMTLFPPMSISLDDNRVKGSHGLIDGDSGQVLCASDFIENAEDIIQLAQLIRKILD